jgi:hypothetical protein
MMKQVLFLSILALSVSATVTAQEVLNITAGLLEGAFHEMELTHLEECITDVDTIGYDIYDAVEEFIKGDFQSILDGIAHIGNAVESIADGISECKDAVEIDFATLAEMGAIFKNPKSLVAQIGKDILLNGRSIKKDIAAFKTDFAASAWEQSGKDLGDALALVLFGKGGLKVTTEESIMPANQYNAYNVLAGYAYIHQADSAVFSELYSSTGVFGEDLMMGVNDLFSSKVKPVFASEVTMFIRKSGFVMEQAATDLQSQGLFTAIDVSKSNECMQSF